MSKANPGGGRLGGLSPQQKQNFVRLVKTSQIEYKQIFDAVFKFLVAPSQKKVLDKTLFLPFAMYCSFFFVRRLNLRTKKICRFYSLQENNGYVKLSRKGAHFWLFQRIFSIKKA